MGGFYGSVQLRTGDRAAVLVAAEAVARELNIKCLVGPALNGWVGVYPEGNGQDHKVGHRIAAAVGGHALHVLVHDDDVLAYWLWQDGQLIDRYHSAPGYFGEENRAEEEPLVGEPARFAFVLGEAGRRRLREVLRHGDSKVMESERLAGLGRLLGIRQAVQAYEYLNEEDGSASTRRRFTLVPADPEAAAAAAAERSAERKQRVARETAARSARKRLLADGLLLATGERDGVVGPTVRAASNGVVVGWSAFHPRPAEVEWRRPPWTGPTVAAGVEVPAAAWFGLHTSEDGRRLVACLGATARVWDLAEDGDRWRHVSDVPFGAFGGATPGAVALSPDGKTLAYVELADHEVIGRDAVTGRRTFAVPGFDRAGLAFSPDGATLAMFGRTIRLVDVARGEQTVGDLFPGGIRPDPMIASRRLAAALLARRGVNVPAEPAGTIWPASPPQAAETVQHLGFSRDGRWMWCGTDNGVRVFDRATLPTAGGAMPPERYRFDIPPILPPIAKSVIAAVEDPAGSAVVFGDWGGRVWRMDLATGDVVRLLVTPPGGCEVFGLCLTADGSALAVASHRPRRPTRARPAASVVTVDVWAYSRLPAGA
jgi:hypothetical protein